MIGLAFLVLTACGASHVSSPKQTGSSSNNVASSGAGYEAFKTSFYAFAQSQNCVKCHGSLVTPKFANSDPAQAYQQARGNEIGSSTPLIDFNNPNSSVFAVYAGNGHCNDTPCSNPANTATVQSLLATWAAAEKAGGGSTTTGGGTGSAVTPKYLTANLSLPATIANYDAATNASTPLRFNLNQAMPADLGAKYANAILEVEVRYTGPSQTHYRFNRMKIYGNNAAGTIVGLHLYIKGASDAGMGNEDLQQTMLWNSIGKPTPVAVPVAARPGTLPATPVNVTPFSTTGLILPKIGAGDVITIGIEILN